MLLARRMPLLVTLARRTTVPGIDADNLLAEAITSLLHKWADDVDRSKCQLHRQFTLQPSADAAHACALGLVSNSIRVNR